MKNEPKKTKRSRVCVESGERVKFGLDVHASQITVCRQIGGLLPQPSQKLSWPRAVEWMVAHVECGAEVFSCYEAGPCGYGLHRRLDSLGMSNYVVAPQRWDERKRRVKTDKRDARELCQRLDRYVCGNTEAFATVYVPSVEQERVRALCRQREAVGKERKRCEVRGHGMMLCQGIQAPSGWWKESKWQQVSCELPIWLREHLRWWQKQAVAFEGELADLTKKVEALARGSLQPKGLGALSAVVIDAEILDWTRFNNRAQVGSYTGLCPSEESSGKKKKQGSVTKCGNPRVRHLLVEAIWRMLAWQPQYPPLHRVRAASSRRMKKRAVTAAARCLAVDLWRIRTGRCCADERGLILFEV
jgi:transposase